MLILFLIQFILIFMLKQKNMEKQISKNSINNKQKQCQREQNYHQQCRFLAELSTANKIKIEGYQAKSNKDNLCHQRTFDAVHTSCPTFLQNICEIINPQTKFKKATYDIVIDELIKITKIQLAYIEQSLSEQQKKQYEQIAQQNKTMNLQGKLAKMIKVVEWTASHMLKADLLHPFLTNNIQLQKQFRLNNLPLTRKLLEKIFNLKLDQNSMIHHLNIIDFYQSIITDYYSQNLEDIILFFNIVQAKYRISNFRKRNGNIVAIKNRQNIQILGNSSKRIQKKQLNQTGDKEKYRYCQVLYIYMEKKPLSQQNLNDIQGNQSNLRFILTKRQLLKLKVKHNANYFSLYQHFQLFKNRSLKQSINTDDSFDRIEQCQWGLIKSADYTAMSKILKSQVYYMNLEEKNSPFARKLCQLTMKRLGLYSNVLKIHQKIDRILQRKPIYICKIQYSLSQFSKQPLQKEDKKKKISVIIATDGFEILYTAILELNSQKKQQFSKFIYETLNKMGFIQSKEKINLVLYKISQPYFIEFQELRSLFTSINCINHIRVYYTVLLENFHIHFMVYMLLRIQLQKTDVNKYNFLLISKQFLSKIIQSIHFSSTLKQNLSQICSSKKQDFNINQDYFYQDQKVFLQIQATYDALCKQIANNRNILLWDKALKVLQFEVLFLTKENNSLNNQVQDLPQVLESQTTFNLPQKQIFMNDYVKEIKMRHPYLTSDQWSAIHNNFQFFLEQKKINAHHLKFILKTVVRLLICYQAYYKWIIQYNELGQYQKQMFQQLNYLKSVYDLQEKRLQTYHVQKKQFIDKYLQILYPESKLQDYEEYFQQKYRLFKQPKEQSYMIQPQKDKKSLNQQETSLKSKENIKYYKVLSQFITCHKSRLQNVQKTQKRPTKRFEWFFIQKFSQIMELEDKLTIKQYAQISKQVIQLIDLEYYQIQASLTQQQHRFYQEIFLSNMKLIDQTRSDFYQQRPSIQSMLKLDLLSIFLKINFGFRKAFDIEDILTLQNLCYIFNIRNSQLLKYKRKFEDNIVILKFLKVNSLEDIILFLVFLGIKLKIRQKKLSNYQKNANELCQKENNEQDYAKKQIISILQTQVQFNLKLSISFFQVAYIPILQKLILEKNIIQQCKITEKLEKIYLTKDPFMKKNMFLEFKKQFGISTLKFIELIQELKLNKSKQIIHQEVKKQQQYVKKQEQQQAMNYQKNQIKIQPKNKDCQRFSKAIQLFYYKVYFDADDPGF